VNYQHHVAHLNAWVILKLVKVTGMSAWCLGMVGSHVYLEDERDDTTVCESMTQTFMIIVESIKTYTAVLDTDM